MRQAPALRSYRPGIFVHGPLLALALVGALPAIVGLGRARSSGSVSRSPRSGASRSR
jgi:hypothetical protein